MSTSRAGLADAFAGLLTLILLVAARNRSRRATIVVAAFLLAAFLVVSDMAGDALARRMGSVAAAFDDRLAVFSLVVEAVGSNPWTGFGLGAFEDLFPLYRDARAGYGGVWNAAHNSYLELMATLGIPAALAFLGSIAIVVGRCAAGAIIRRKDAAPALVATATTAQLGLHSLFDFPLQIQGHRAFLCCNPRCRSGASLFFRRPDACVGQIDAASVMMLLSTQRLIGFIGRNRGKVAILGFHFGASKAIAFFGPLAIAAVLDATSYAALELALSWGTLLAFAASLGIPSSYPQLALLRRPVAADDILGLQLSAALLLSLAMTAVAGAIGGARPALVCAITALAMAQATLSITSSARHRSANSAHGRPASC